MDGAQEVTSSSWPTPSSKHDHREVWKLRVSEVAEPGRGKVAAPADASKVTFVEMADVLFRTNSAVVLPEGEAPSSDGEKQEAFTSVGALATALRFNDEHTGKKVLVAGHTDTEGATDFNQTLSNERAKCGLALLMGDRESFKSVCDGRHTVADYKQILAWVSRAFEELVFRCDPGKIDDDEASGVEPVRCFQKAYNTNKSALGAAGPALATDGSVGLLTWGAFFDCYEFALRDELGEDSAGLARLREKVVFVDNAHRAVGFGEYFPVDELGVDGYESSENRRVEVRFFDPGEEPDVAHAASDPETSEIYLPGFYAHVPVSGSAKRHSTLRLWLFDPFRRLMGNAPYRLKVGTQTRENTAGKNGQLVEERVEPVESVDLEWGDATAPHESRDPGRKPARYLYKTRITLNWGAPAESQRDAEAARILTNLGYTGSFTDQVAAFQVDAALEQRDWFDETTMERLRGINDHGQESGPPAELALSNPSFVPLNQLA